MRTSDPDIFAVGDAVEVKDAVTGACGIVALAGPANKQGRIAADNAMGRTSVYRGGLGTFIAKVFDLSAAATGASEKRLRTHNIPYLVSYTHPGSHASYYPGAANMAIKLIFSPQDGRVLGAQIVGMDGVDKRIDVLACAMKAGMTVYDLEELELAYAPPYSSAKDPVNIAGYAAANILKGDVEQIVWNELPASRPRKRRPHRSSESSRASSGGHHPRLPPYPPSRASQTPAGTRQGQAVRAVLRRWPAIVHSSPGARPARLPVEKPRRGVPHVQGGQGEDRKDGRQAGPCY